MRMLRRGTALTVVLMALVSCTGLFKKKEEDAGVTVTPPVTTAVPGTPVPTAPVVLALNQGDIARYPDETPLPAPTKAAFQRAYNIRESIPNGKVVFGFGKGAVANQIAKRAQYVLITFEHPTSPGVTMMGWVHQDAFSLVIADAGAQTCAAGETPLFTDVPTCGRVCTKDADCSAGLTCAGTSNKLAAGNKPGEAVKVCIPPHDAGAPAPNPNPTPTAPNVVDAGQPPPAVVDAGPPPVVDAGKSNNNSIAPPPIGTDEVNALPNKTCPATFVYVTKTGHCHRPCPTGIGGCHPTHFCLKCDKDNKKVCANKRTVCE